MRYPNTDDNRPGTIMTEVAVVSVADSIVEKSVENEDHSGSRIDTTKHTDVISVFIVDDHALLREGLRQLFTLEDDIQVIGEASDGFSAIEQIRQQAPDIVLMDIHLPIVDGIAMTRQITAQFPEVAVIMLTMHAQQQQVVDAIKSGARGYLLKSSSVHELAEALRVVHDGDIAITPSLTGALVNELRRFPEESIGTPHLSQLSEKEIEIIRYLAAGMSNKEIAEQLAYSEKTVKNYLSVIFQKLHLRDRTQVAIFALRQGLLPEEDPL